jgi:integrase
MRRRNQKGSLQLRKQGGVWVWLGMWREGEHRRTKTLGQKSQMTKTDAREKLNKILTPLNAKQEQTDRMQFGVFVHDVYYPFSRRKWKRSTRITTEDRMKRHLIPELVGLELRNVNRVALQDLLDRKAGSGLSFSVVGHLRWDLRHIFRVAVAEGMIERNPAELLFTPQTATRAVRRVATAEEMARVFAAVDLRERLILKLAGIAGMRPGEILALQWVNLEPPYAEIRQRVYRGDIDSPKSPKSIRKAAVGESLLAEIAQWRVLSASTAAEAWVFPSETGSTPLRPNSLWRRVGPKLAAVGLGWINFQVLRRSCSSLMNDQGTDGKVVADQRGHTLDVNQNVYTRVAFDRQAEAVNKLDSLFRMN